MSDRLRASVEKLKQSTVELNKITDDAAQVVRATEAFLNKECSSGIESYVIVSTRNVDELEQESTLLRYERWEGKFRITVWIGLDSENCEVKPWSEWDRATKLETVKKLPELLETIATDTANYVNSAQQATTTVAELLKALDRKEGK